jgi:hypothetical protein
LWQWYEPHELHVLPRQLQPQEPLPPGPVHGAATATDVLPTLTAAIVPKAVVVAPRRKLRRFSTRVVRVRRSFTGLPP